MNRPARRENIHAPRSGRRVEPVSIQTLAGRAVKAWRKAHLPPDADLSEAMLALEASLGPALVDAA